MSIHETIKARRLQLGLSHTDLAKRVNELTPNEKPIKRQAVQHWEKKTAPKRARLQAVADVLKTTPAELLKKADVDIDLSGPRAGPAAEDLLPLLKTIQRLDPSRYERLAKNITALEESSRSSQDLLTGFGADTAQSEETGNFAKAPRRANGPPQDTSPVGLSGFDELHDPPAVPKKKRR